MAIRSRSNPWVAVAMLALTGWFLDSALVALELHRLPGMSLWVHWSHLWYGPPLLVAVLLITRRRLPQLAQWSENLAAVEELARELRPEVKQLAGQVTGSETKVAVLGFYWRHRNMAVTPTDLAYHSGQELPDVERALAELGALGLVEVRSACNLKFYGLTTHKRRLAQLDELVAWQESWLERARRMAQVVGPSLLRQDGHR